MSREARSLEAGVCLTHGPFGLSASPSADNQNWFRLGNAGSNSQAVALPAPIGCECVTSNNSQRRVAGIVGNAGRNSSEHRPKMSRKVQHGGRENCRRWLAHAPRSATTRPGAVHRSSGARVSQWVTLRKFPLFRPASICDLRPSISCEDQTFPLDRYAIAPITVKPLRGYWVFQLIQLFGDRSCS